MVGGPLHTPASSTIKTGRHDIAKILLKVALSIKSNQNQIILNDYVDLIHIHIRNNTLLINHIIKM